MEHVLSLIGSEANPPLDERDATRVEEVIRRAGGRAAGGRWLGGNLAYERHFEGDARETLAPAREAFAERPIDVNVLPAAGRRKRLLIADMDSTLIHQECIDELADHIGRRDEVAAITERAMRGEIEFAPALRERVALLAGLPETVPAEVLKTRIVLMEGGCTLVRTMRAHGAHTMLISGGFTIFAEAIAARLGFQEFQANRLETSGGRFTGQVADPILGREAKEAALRQRSSALGIDLAETLAVGDGANDAGMIVAAGLGVAYRAKAILRDKADAVVSHGDLTALLFLQGFGEDEFIRD